MTGLSQSYFPLQNSLTQPKTIVYQDLSEARSWPASHFGQKYISRGSFWSEVFGHRIFQSCNF